MDELMVELLHWKGLYKEMKDSNAWLYDRVKKLERENKVLKKEVLASLSGEGIFYSGKENIKELEKIPGIREQCYDVGNNGEPTDVES